MIELEFLSIRVFLVKVTHWPRETFFFDSVLKTNPCTYKLKDLNRAKTIGSFYERNLCWVYFKWVVIQN